MDSSNQVSVEAEDATFGLTPLHFAARWGGFAERVERGTRNAQRDGDGWISMAFLWGNPEMVANLVMIWDCLKMLGIFPMK